jgi:hypothetical protein
MCTNTSSVCLNCIKYRVANVSSFGGKRRDNKMFCAVSLCLWHEAQSEVHVKAHGFIARYKRAFSFYLYISCRQQTIGSCCLSNTRYPLRGIKIICFHGIEANTKAHNLIVFWNAAHNPATCFLKMHLFSWFGTKVTSFRTLFVNFVSVWLPPDSLKTQKS